MVGLGFLVRGGNVATRGDAEVIEGIAGWRPDGLVELAKAVTLFGRFDVVLLIVLAAAAYVIVRSLRAKHEGDGAIWLVALTPFWALCLSGPINALVKSIVERPRPAEAMRAVVEQGTGFSSGHSANAAAAWIALALVLPTQHHRAWLAAGAAMAVAVGSSRIILGVHSPTDVIGGWCLGLACALIAWQLTGRIARRGQTAR